MQSDWHFYFYSSISFLNGKSCCKYKSHGLHFITPYPPYILLRVAGSCGLRFLFAAIADVELPVCDIGLPMVFREQPTRLVNSTSRISSLE